MRIARIAVGNEVRYGQMLDQRTLGLFPADWCLFQFLRDPATHAIKDLREKIDFDDSSILAPVPMPSKVICVGKNYAEHAAEMGSSNPELPIIFSKYSSAVVGESQPVVLPALAEQVDYEAELVVVIGTPGKRIRRDEAWNHVGGYMCGNDVSARDWQKGRPGGQWLLGKSFDTFAPTGPWLVTPDEVEDVTNLPITLTLNGQVMQSANTNSMLYPIDYLIWHVSQFFELQTGDLIFTGTPAGVGAGRNPPVFLRPGDTTVVTIDQIGSLRSRFIAESNV